MSEAKIIQDDMSVAGSTWIIKKHATNEVVWSKPGGGLGLVVDNDGYLAYFESFFPLMVVRWGAGAYRLEAVVAGAAMGRVGGMSAYWEAPDLETANQARKEIKSGLMEPSFVTRTTRTDTGSLPMRTHTGNLQMDSGQRVPVGNPDAGLNQGGDMASHIKRTEPMPGLLGYGNTIGDTGVEVKLPVPEVAKAAKSIAFSTEPCCERDHNKDGNCDVHAAPGVLRNQAMDSVPDPGPVREAFENSMRILTQALRGTLIKRQLTWIDRLRNAAETLNATEVIPREPVSELRARFYVGDEVIINNINVSLLYHLGTGEAHHAYLNWFAAYQRLETIFFTDLELRGTIRSDCEKAESDATVQAWLTGMVWDAATLYLAEATLGMGPGTLKDSAGAAIRRCCNFIADKDADYGQPIRRHGIKGLMTRVFDKWSRYTVLASRPDRDGKFESIKDTAMDLLCYSIMIYAAYQEQVENEAANLGA